MRPSAKTTVPDQASAVVLPTDETTSPSTPESKGFLPGQEVLALAFEDDFFEGELLLDAFRWAKKVK